MRKKPSLKRQGPALKPGIAKPFLLYPSLTSVTISLISLLKFSAITKNSLAIAKDIYRYILLKSFASSALVASVVKHEIPRLSKNILAFLVDRISMPPIICGISFISWIDFPSAILSGQKARKISFPTLNFVFSSIVSLIYLVVFGEIVLRKIIKCSFFNKGMSVVIT